MKDEACDIYSKMLDSFLVLQVWTPKMKFTLFSEDFFVRMSFLVPLKSTFDSGQIWDFKNFRK